MKKINFMPATFKRAQARRQRALLLSLALLALAAVGWWRLKIESIERLESMQAELTALERQTERLGASDQVRRAATERIVLQRSLEAPVPSVSVIAMVTEHTAPTVGLTSLSLTSQPVDPIPSGGDKKRKKKRAKDDDGGPPPMTLVLEGTAPDDITVAQIIEQLDSQPMFRNVELGFCRPTEDGAYEGRSFQIMAQVPQDRTVIIDRHREVTRAD